VCVAADAVRHVWLWPLLLLGFLARRAAEVVFAVVLIFEEWGWQPLARFMAWLGTFKLVARLERRISALPPYGALAVFALPSLLILPLKLLALYLITTGHAVAAAALFIGAKLAGTAVLARLYTLVSPRLMQIRWFARLHDRLMPWKDALFARVRASWAWRYARILKHRVGQRLRTLTAVWRPVLRAAAARLRGAARETTLRVRAWFGGGRF
jgi:hypothetical protein